MSGERPRLGRLGDELGAVPAAEAENRRRPEQVGLDGRVGQASTELAQRGERSIRLGA